MSRSEEKEPEGHEVGLITCRWRRRRRRHSLVGGVAQAFHDDRVVELRVQLEVHEKEENGGSI